MLPRRNTPYLGPDALPKGVTIWSIVTKPRPVAPSKVVRRSKLPLVRLGRLRDEFEKRCVAVYTEEVLAQLRYRQDVDVARREYGSMA